MLHAQVAVPVPLGQAFTYSIPEALRERVVRGARVLCEFGRRRILGVVLEVGQGDVDLPPERVKPIEAVVDSEPVLPEELLGFLIELSRYYLAPIGEVMRLALPAIERGAARSLQQQGLLEGTRVNAIGRLGLVARAADGEGGAKLRGQAAGVLERLRANGPTPVAELVRQFSAARSAVKKLERLGLVVTERVALERDPFFTGPVARDVPPELNAAQRVAVDALCERLDARARGAFLLAGVTASGKTEVYLRAAQRALEAGGSAILLVPEIALTPQLVQRFRARLGDSIAVLHSGLSPTDRHAMWRALRAGELRVAVGARSALFAPVQGLALICVDEEHDGSYKQEEGVRYHARDMALLRAYRAGAVCVVGSATPSLTSEALVRAGKLQRLTLPERARRSAQLPRAEVIDLRKCGPGPGGQRLLTVPLFRALEENVQKGEQAILFLNRRGFSPSLVCDDCGQVVECPNCSVALTLHRARGDHLRCHYCDHTVGGALKCAACGSARLAREGAGTERIEAVLKEALPAARIARLDRDVAAGLKSERVIERMRRGEVDILVGTQMVTKGHDLPNVTLVGVLNADASLSIPDYQAAERTFQLLVQVAGRAGRAEAAGTVLIQTRNPDHPAIRMALRHDVAGFVESELGARRELDYPPFSHLALVRVDAADEALASRTATGLASAVRRTSGACDVLGPAPAPVARVRNRYRYRFLVRSASRKIVRQALLPVRTADTDRRVRVVIDVDPVNML